MDAVPAQHVSHRDVPFQQRWERLKPVIIDLYVKEDKSLSEVIATMKAEHGFDAVENQYKYHFRKWGISKNINSFKKRKLMDKAQDRAKAGKRTAFSVQNKPVDPRRILRAVKTESRREIFLKPANAGKADSLQCFPWLNLQWGSSIFMSWNKPYGAMNFQRTSERDHSSPFGHAVSTPSDIIVTTPRSNNAGSPNDAPSPLSKALVIKNSVDRARMFAEGRFDDLIKHMNKEEAITMSSWLYQFWFFSFKTAKHWGRGPPSWNAENLFLDDSQILGSLRNPIFLESELRNTESESSHSQPPSLCRWSIHYKCGLTYEPIPEPERASEPDPHDERSWPVWPESLRNPPFHERLVRGLESNNFSTIKKTELPVAVPQIVKATERSPDVLLTEALGFSIMGRNADLTAELVEKFDEGKATINGLRPLHLATSFLDGATTCCNILASLLHSTFGLDTVRERRKLYVNDLDHTVLDNLMITILRSHSSTVPGDVDERMKNRARFDGEEIDICGRWDADSKYVRGLFGHTETPILPASWKHKFCHTSIQAICHCIDLLYGSEVWQSELWNPSGLFLKYCSECGLKMQLQPLHTLVMTAFHLANHGSTDEDLFGMLACLLCLLSCDVLPIRKAELSTEILYGRSPHAVGCVHEKLTPAELADRIPSVYIEAWPAQVKTGWKVFCFVLRLAETALVETLAVLHDEQHDTDMTWNEDETEEAIMALLEYGRDALFEKRPVIGVLYAAVQAEFLTYRRLREGDPWISANFSLSGLLQDFEEGNYDIPSIGLVAKKLLKPFGGCGAFSCRTLVPGADDACVHYFSNMDDWFRTKFIHFPDAYVTDL